MYLGLDVGGTHTDAVIIDGGHVVSSCKTVTHHEDLLKSIDTALREVTCGIAPGDITSVNLSTTLCTNAIVEGRTEAVGVLVSSGPGIDPSGYSTGDTFHVLQGSIDHRGKEVQPLSEKELDAAVKKLEKLSLFAVVTKFSTRNPSQERHISARLEKRSDFTTMGHTLSGQLNFPRRINTAYFNSTVWRIYNAFADAIEKSFRDMGITTAINILKADGGTIPLPVSRLLPVETILSGPAASVMGTVGLCDLSGDSVVLDIGGTTTDIAIFAQGQPLVERKGISIDNRATLVRSLETRSIGVGGDSAIRVEGGDVLVGPHRLGPAMAAGGSEPALVDAMNLLGLTSYGDLSRSAEGLEAMSRTSGIPAAELAVRAVDRAAESICCAVDGMVRELNGKPVYTIHEMLHADVITPRHVYLMGGPAEGFREVLAKRFGLDVTVPPHHGIANAIGAALARTTFSAELFADTVRGACLIPSLGIDRRIDAGYTLDDAVREARDGLARYLEQHGVAFGDDEISVTETSDFRMVTGYYSTGRDIRVRCQLRPAVSMKVRDEQGGDRS